MPAIHADGYCNDTASTGKRSRPSTKSVSAHALATVQHAPRRRRLILLAGNIQRVIRKPVQHRPHVAASALTRPLAATPRETARHVKMNVTRRVAHACQRHIQFLHPKHGLLILTAIHENTPLPFTSQVPPRSQRLTPRVHFTHHTQPRCLAHVVRNRHKLRNGTRHLKETHAPTLVQL